MDLSKSICCGSFLSLRYSITPAQEGKPCIKYIAYTDTKRCRQESWIVRESVPVRTVLWIVYVSSRSLPASLPTVYSDIQFTPTGDEPVIKTYVSVHKGTAESRMKRLFRKEAYRQASL